MMLLTGVPEGDVVTAQPAVASRCCPANRSDDLVRQSTEYLAAGVGQYWIDDPRDRVIDIFERRSTGWDRVAQLTEESPDAAVGVPGLGEVALSMAGVLGEARA